MQNEAKEFVDIIIPRKCYATNRILNAKDFASIVITLPAIFTENHKEENICLSGFVRSKGQSDAALNKFFRSKGLLSFE